MPSSDPHAEVSPRDALARLLDGVQTLFREHLALAKVELKDDLRRVGRDALLSAAGLPPLLVGYVLLMVALALLVGQVLPAWIAFGLVAFLNLVAGAALTKVYASRVRQEKARLPGTGEELRRDREWLASLRESSSRPGARIPAPIDARQGASFQAPIATPVPGQPVAGATSTPDGEPMTAERNEPLRH